MRVSGQAERTCGARSVAARSGGGGLRCPADVAMVQTADFGNLQDPARLGELDGSDVGGVLVEREVRASLVTPALQGIDRCRGARRRFGEGQDANHERISVRKKWCLVDSASP